MSAINLNLCVPFIKITDYGSQKRPALHAVENKLQFTLEKTSVLFSIYSQLLKV
jgi:hypothetical protein